MKFTKLKKNHKNRTLGKKNLDKHPNLYNRGEACCFKAAWDILGFLCDITHNLNFALKDSCTHVETLNHDVVFSIFLYN